MAKSSWRTLNIFCCNTPLVSMKLEPDNNIWVRINIACECWATNLDVNLVERYSAQNLELNSFKVQTEKVKLSHTSGLEQRVDWEAVDDRVDVSPCLCYTSIILIPLSLVDGPCPLQPRVRWTVAKPHVLFLWSVTGCKADRCKPRLSMLWNEPPCIWVSHLDRQTIPVVISLQVDTSGVSFTIQRTSLEEVSFDFVPFLLLQCNIHKWQCQDQMILSYCSNDQAFIPPSPQSMARWTFWCFWILTDQAHLGCSGCIVAATVGRAHASAGAQSIVDLLVWWTCRWRLRLAHSCWWLSLVAPNLTSACWSLPLWWAKGPVCVWICSIASKWPSWFPIQEIIAKINKARTPQEVRTLIRLLVRMAPNVLHLFAGHSDITFFLYTKKFERTSGTCFF